MEILELNHVALHVKDVEASVHFYQHILGFPPMSRPAFDFPGAWFRLGAHQELHLIGERSKPVNSDKRGNHFALKCKSIEQVQKHLEDKNFEYSGPAKRPDGIQQIFIKDPDGHYIEFFQS
ncbi:VOC family protein [soil metagenome]